jgi:hypothetical protein
MRTLLILSLVMSSFAHGTTVLVQGPQSHPLDYRATLKAHADTISPTQDYLNSHPSVASREALLAAFAEAQRAFLENSGEEAPKKIGAVLDLLPNEDWAKSDREIFLHAYLRLAQIETDGGARDRWLTLSLLLGEDLAYDATLFPPPLLLRREELRKEIPSKIISRRLLGAGWNQVLINGVACGARDCGQWPRTPGRVRVTFLSDQWVPQTMTAESDELERLTPREIAWVEGGCSRTQWSQQAERIPAKRAFFSLECDKPELPIALNLKPTAAAAPAIPALSVTTSSPPLYENKWLWIGVGTVLAVVLVAASQKKVSRETTTTYGY